MTGKIELIGVYQLPVTEDLVAAQADVQYGQNPSLEQCAATHKQLESTILIEVLVSDADANFDVDDFAQENPQLPEASWQVAWAEAFLSADGQQLLVERGKFLPPNYTTFRVAFFIHDWQHDKPLLTSYGSLPVSQPTVMPDRLLRFVPYELLD